MIAETWIGFALNRLKFKSSSSERLQWQSLLNGYIKKQCDQLAKPKSVKFVPKVVPEVATAIFT